MDTSIDGLSSTTPYNQTSQEALRTKMATAYALRPTRTQEPARSNGHWGSQDPARPQNQWGMQAHVKFQSQWGPGGPQAVQTMPAAPLTCYGCGQAGHM